MRVCVRLFHFAFLRQRFVVVVGFVDGKTRSVAESLKMTMSKKATLIKWMCARNLTRAHDE